MNNYTFDMQLPDIQAVNHIAYEDLTTSKKDNKESVIKVIHKSLYEVLRTKANRPYKVAVQVLSELIFYYASNRIGELGWNVRYNYFYDDLKHSHMTIFRAIIYLAEIGLITKHIKNRKSQRTHCANSMYLELHVERLLQLVPELHILFSPSNTLQSNNIVLPAVKISDTLQTFDILSKCEDILPKCEDVLSKCEDVVNIANSSILALATTHVKVEQVVNKVTKDTPLSEQEKPNAKTTYNVNSLTLGDINASQPCSDSVPKLKRALLSKYYEHFSDEDASKIREKSNTDYSTEFIKNLIYKLLQKEKYQKWSCYNRTAFITLISNCLILEKNSDSEKTANIPTIATESSESQAQETMEQIIAEDNIKDDTAIGKIQKAVLNSQQNGVALYKSWFRNARLVSQKSEEISIDFLTSFKAGYIMQNYFSLIKQALGLDYTTYFDVKDTIVTISWRPKARMVDFNITEIFNVV